MLDAIVNKLKSFREKIYCSFEKRQDAAMELIDSLSSNTTAKSVVELSLNPVHRRNYCSITRVIDEFTQKDSNQPRGSITPHLAEYCPELSKRSYHLFGVDCTSSPRLFSPTVADRGYVYTPNTVPGNKPITIGHQYSVLTYFPEKDVQSPPWVIPLSCERVGTDQKGVLIGMKQISLCIQSQDSFKERPCVSVGDSAYSHPGCLAEARNNPNQIHVSRVRNNRAFYYPSTQIKAINQKGRPQCYGDKHYLKDEKTWRSPDESAELEAMNKKDKLQKIKIDCWNKMMMRGKRNCDMSEFPFRLLRVRVYRASGELIFRKPMWLIVSGEKHFKLSLQDIFNIYRQRFDIEHFFRFGKDKLLMNKIQTPDVTHEEAWWKLVMIAYVQLYLAREVAENLANPWEKYLPTVRANSREKSPSQVQKDFQRIIKGIGTPAKPPKPRNKSLGRLRGETQFKRPCYSVVFKGKKFEAGAHNTA
jgi:hypothetical protein